MQKGHILGIKITNISYIYIYNAGEDTLELWSKQLDFCSCPKFLAWRAEIELGVAFGLFGKYLVLYSALTCKPLVVVT